ncbi:MAG: HlyD family secretion protein [Polyangiaceae bacterium]|nr:HlyD family secretion protein [Polyangiaceae bacterium]
MPTPGGQEEWTASEAGFAGFAAEVSRLLRRARVSLTRTLLIALAVTVLAVGNRSLKKRQYAAHVVFRVTEGELNTDTAPPTRGRLKNYLSEVALSSSRLARIITQYDLYATRRRIDMQLAIESMREDIDVDVLSNYFSQQRYRDDPPRSARVIVEFRATDPQLALDVARTLAQTIQDDESSRRQQAAELDADATHQAARGLREQLTLAQGRLAEAQLDLARAKPSERAGPIVELENARRSVMSLEARLKDASKRQSDFDFRATLETQRLGLRFEVLDFHRPRLPLLPQNAELAIFAVIVFLVLVPAVGIALAAFDGRLYDVDDIRRLGVLPCGHINLPRSARLGIPNRQPRRERV